MGWFCCMNLKIVRNVILVLMAFVFAYLFGQWNSLKRPLKLETNNIANNIANNNIDNQQQLIAPPVSNNMQNNILPKISNKSDKNNQQDFISVKTPLVNAKISLNNGNLVQLSLLKYPVSLKDKTPMQLLDNSFESESGLNYQAISGLIGDGIDIPSNMLFTAKQKFFNMPIGNNSDKGFKVDLTWQNDQLQIIKSYIFSSTDYTIKVYYEVKNLTTKTINAKFVGQLNKSPIKHKNSLFSSYTNFTGSVISTSENHYQKQSFKKILDNPIQTNSIGGWAAMIQHYFVTAWVPDQKNKNQFYTKAQQFGNKPVYIAGMITPGMSVQPNQSNIIGATLFAGPALTNELHKVAPYLDLTVDYGWLWFIGKILFFILNLFHTFVGNWGFSIILLTLTVKLIFFPLSAKSYSSMAKMKKLQPQIESLKKQHDGDKQAFSKAMMSLYQKEKVNPLGGCLPILVQIPVFIALYWVLMESVQLRQAPFIFWIHDLSVKDPMYVLPILMGASMFLQQKMNPPPPDPTQAKVMMMLPFVFTFMFLQFASGLVLYWVVNNSFSILQQWFIMRKYK